MASGAGGAFARRRRDLRSCFLLFSFLSVNLPKNPNLTSSSGFIYSDRFLCNGAREQCFLISLNQTSPTNLSSKLISEETISNGDKATRKTPATLPLSDPPCLTLPSTRLPASTPHLVLPSTLTPASTQHLLRRALISPPSLASRHASTISSSAKAKLGFPLEGLAFKTGPSTPSRPKPIICAPIIDETKPRSVKSPLFLLSISNQCLGRKLILKCRRHHLRQNSTSLLLIFNHTLRTLGLVSNMAMSLEEDWKKTHVDSKKIFAQPHQSLQNHMQTRDIIESDAKRSSFLSADQSYHRIWETSQPSQIMSRQIEQTYSVKEIPLLQPYSVVGNQTLSVASSMEQIIKSSYASFARAIYDHKLIRNFKLEFLKVSKDFPTFANSLKMCILDYSLSLYLFFSCIVLPSVCMNFPLLRI